MHHTGGQQPLLGAERLLILVAFCTNDLLIQQSVLNLSVFVEVQAEAVDVGDDGALVAHWISDVLGRYQSTHLHLVPRCGVWMSCGEVVGCDE